MHLSEYAIHSSESHTMSAMYRAHTFNRQNIGNPCPDPFLNPCLPQCNLHRLKAGGIASPGTSTDGTNSFLYSINSAFSDILCDVLTRTASKSPFLHSRFPGLPGLKYLAAGTCCLLLCGQPAAVGKPKAVFALLEQQSPLHGYGSTYEGIGRHDTWRSGPTLYLFIRSLKTLCPSQVSAVLICQDVEVVRISVFCFIPLLLTFVPLPSHCPSRCFLLWPYSCSFIPLFLNLVLLSVFITSYFCPTSCSSCFTIGFELEIWFTVLASVTLQ